ncbi:unnamed protein product [Rotaria magnacalcarata]|uniref:CxC5 like cysteine cluster associated with KDZ domain-containing protein n=2 Tax=Rotaria magnacalcarata TaxID=392030 RepID=A0A817A8U3_9BILA|nr:unnamed protein product [Rotaria magnacalcarata]
MFSNVYNSNSDENEIFIVSLNRNIPIQHLNLVNQLDVELDDCLLSKYIDISNMIDMVFGKKYDPSFIECILNLLKSKQIAFPLFSQVDAKFLINNYSNNHHVLTLSSLHTIKPFTSVCLNCGKSLKLQFKEKVNVFLIDRVENGTIYIANCCQIDYFPNSFLKMWKRFVVPGSIQNKKYIHFGGKSVLTIEIVLRYAADLVNLYSGFENFAEGYNDTMLSLLLSRSNKQSNQVTNPPLLERRLFENIWMIYSSTLITIFLSKTQEIQIPLNISDRHQMNTYFNETLPIWEHQFILFWSNHSVRNSCGDNCSGAIVIDGFQKPDRFVCQFTDVIHSNELGDIDWGCGFRPEMIQDKKNPGFWKNTNFCPKHVHLNNDQSTEDINNSNDYDNIDCNVSRNDRYTSRKTSYGIILTIYNCGIIVNFDELYRSESPMRVIHHLLNTIEHLSPAATVPKYLIYDNACGLILTLRNRLERGKITQSQRTDAL